MTTLPGLDHGPDHPSVVVVYLWLIFLALSGFYIGVSGELSQVRRSTDAQVLILPPATPPSS